MKNIYEDFLNSKIKIKVDCKDGIFILKELFKGCNLIESFSGFNLEIGRYYWVEKGLFGNNKHLLNSMNIMKRNKDIKTVLLSEIFITY